MSGLLPRLYQFKFRTSPPSEAFFAASLSIGQIFRYLDAADLSPYAHSAKLNLKWLISCAIGYLWGHDIDHVGNLTKLMPLHGQRELLQKGHILIYAVNISFGSLDSTSCVSGSMFP